MAAPSTVVYPTAALRELLEAASTNPDLTPAERVRELRQMRDRLAALAGQAETLLGEAQLRAEASLSNGRQLAEARENADLRDELLRRGLATPEKLDALGYLSHDELDRRVADGTLREAVEHRDDVRRELADLLSRDEPAELVEAVGRGGGALKKWDAKKHPRNRRNGEFIQVLKALKVGEGVEMPDGTTVTKGKGGKFSVRGAKPGENLGVRDAAKRGLDASAAKKDPRSLGGAKSFGSADEVPDDGEEPPRPPGAGWSEPKPKPKPQPPAPEPAAGPAPDADADDDGVIDVGDDVNKAAELLAEGKKVRLEQPREVSTLLDELSRRVKEAVDKGEEAPNFDLCKVSVKNTNLFCAESKGIPRVEMPQLKGVPEPGSRADALPRDSRGEVDLSAQFRAELEERGVAIVDEEEQASMLRASQRELNGAKVAGIVGALNSGVVIEGRIFVSSDNYIVDGHHRWAAEVGVDLQDNKLGDVDMQVARVDMGIIELLAESNRFAADWGIPQAAFGQGFANPEGGGAPTK